MEQAAIMDAFNTIPQNKVCPECGKPYVRRRTHAASQGVMLPDCDCLTKKLVMEENKRLCIEQCKMLKKRFRDASFPYDTRNKLLKNLDCEHIEIAKEYLRRFQPKKRQGLYFVGNVGNGKTTLAVCIGKELVIRGYKVKFMVFSQAIRLLQSTYGNKNSLEFMEQVNEFTKYDLLIFDDFGREAYKDRTLTDVADFINTLYSEQVNVIITSNPEMVEKIKKIPDFNAMLDRFFQMTVCKEFKRPSYRREEAQRNLIF